MKPANVKPGKSIEYGFEHSDKDPKFKVGDYVKISKYKDIFPKDYSPNWSYEVFLIKKLMEKIYLSCLLWTNNYMILK